MESIVQQSLSVEVKKVTMDAIQELQGWIDTQVFPFSNGWEEAQALPPEILDAFAAKGWFGAAVPKEWGGQGLDSLSLGRMCAHIARGSVSLLSIFTVHCMVCQALLRWGTQGQKEQWLPGLSRGTLRAAFALTEPERGSDAAGLLCMARRVEDAAPHVSQGFVLEGSKKWISASAHAHLFLVFAKLGEEGLAAFLVPASTQGLRLTPMKDLLGFRAAGIAQLCFEGCPLSAEALLGPPGGGFSFVASHALDCGRFIVGFGAAGIMEGCLQAATAYASERVQFNQPLRKHQLIQELIANMATDLAAGQALAMQAAVQREAGSPDSIMSIATAKYFCSRAALRAASDALQIHGGNGASPEYPVMRYFRDAKICEIIEGSSQMHQLMIANDALVRYGRKRRRKHD